MGTSPRLAGATPTVIWGRPPPWPGAPGPAWEPAHLERMTPIKTAARATAAIQRKVRQAGRLGRKAEEAVGGGLWLIQTPRKPRSAAPSPLAQLRTGQRALCRLNSTPG